MQSTTPHASTTPTSSSTRLYYPCLRIYAEMNTYMAERSRALRVLFVGGGGYTMPRYMETVYPDAALEVAEIDPGVTRAAREMLGLSPSTRVLTYNRDAR